MDLTEAEDIKRWEEYTESHHFINRSGNSEHSGWLYFFWAPNSLRMVTAAMKLKDAYSLEGKLWQT